MKIEVPCFLCGAWVERKILSDFPGVNAHHKTCGMGVGRQREIEGEMVGPEEFLVSHRIVANALNEVRGCPATDVHPVNLS